MRKTILSVLLILSLLLTTTIFRHVQAQEQYTLELQSHTWRHSTISVLIVPPDNKTWWNPVYINSTLRAIDQWNNAIAEFSANHSEFAYLSELRISSAVSNETKAGFSVYIFWTERMEERTADEIGLAATYTDQFSIIINCTINFATKTQLNYTLSEVDMQNIALHELGHSLGLRHSNYTGDLMYSKYRLGSPVLAISNLDMYGVATIFQWMQNPSQLYPVSDWLKNSSVTITANEYQQLPIAKENLPHQPFPDSYLQPALTSLEYILQFVMRPEVLVTITATVIALVTAILLTQKRKKQQSNSTMAIA